MQGGSKITSKSESKQSLISEDDDVQQQQQQQQDCKENNHANRQQQDEAIEIIWTSCGCSEWSGSSSSIDWSSTSSASFDSHCSSSQNCCRCSQSLRHDQTNDRKPTIIKEQQQQQQQLGAGSGSGKKFKLSRRRWSILAGLCIFGFLNGLVNELTTILSTLTDLLDWKLDEYIYVSQIFNYIRPIILLPCAWLIDRFGLRRTMYVALSFALLRNTSRIFLFSPNLSANWHEMKFLYWSICTLSEQVVVCIYYSLPLKVSESWFPQNERSMAFTGMLVFPTLGGAISSFVLPHIIKQKQSLHWLAKGNLFVSLISIVIVVTTITRSRPRQAPSTRSSEAERGLLQATQIGRNRMCGGEFGVNLKNFLTNFPLLIQIFTATTFQAMQQAIGTIFQDVLAASDLSQTFCGNFLALNGVFGTIIQVFSSWYLDRKSSGGTSRHSSATSSSNNNSKNRNPMSAKQRTWLMKSFMLLTYLSFVLYLSSLSLEKLLGQYQWVLVIVSSLLYASIWCWTVPFYNDLVADLILLSPVSQATVSAASGAIYVLLNNPYQIIFMYLRQVSPSSSPGVVVGASDLTTTTTTTAVAPSTNKTTTMATTTRVHAEKADYSRSMLFAGLIVSSVTFIYVTCFSGPASQCDDQSSPSVAATAAAAATMNNNYETNKRRHCHCSCSCCRRQSATANATANATTTTTTNHS